VLYDGATDVSEMLEEYNPCQADQVFERADLRNASSWHELIELVSLAESFESI
jgi:hypothetical protein